MTEDLLTTFNISLVVRGSVSETGIANEEEHKRYTVPKQKGIMRCVLSEPALKHSPGPSSAESLAFIWCFLGASQRSCLLL